MTAREFGGYIGSGYLNAGAEKTALTASDVVAPIKNLGAGAWDATKDVYGKVHGLIPVTALEGAALGGVGLATAAGTYGLINPGHYMSQDEKGKPVKKRRSRFMGSMYYSTLGKILGTIAGGAVGHMYPKHMHELNKSIGDYGSGVYNYLLNNNNHKAPPELPAPELPAFDYGIRPLPPIA